MKLANKPGLLLSVLALLCWQELAAAACSEKPAGEPKIHASLEQDLLTLETRNARLFAVLEELGRLAGFTTRRFNGAEDCSLVNANIKNLPMVKAVERLVAGTNRIIFYGAGDSADPRDRISQVWLLGAATGDGSLALANDNLPGLDPLEQEDPAARSNAVLGLSREVDVGVGDDEDIDIILARMGQALQQDAEPLVRSRAAIALGAMGDAAAVGDLEIALQDENFSVRTQAIGALGRIGGDRATTALGTILLNPNTQTVERVMAAQALWRHDSDTARSYLLLAADDSDEQVREASTQPPSTATTDQLRQPAGAENAN